MTDLIFSKRLLKYVQSLHSRKYRQKYNKFIAQGPKIVTEILQTEREMEFLFCTDSYYELNSQIISQSQAPVVIVNQKELKSISTHKTPKDALCVCEMDVYDNFSIKDQSWSIYLDSVQDPGNVGTIVRTADWFGIDYVFLGGDTADLHNPKVIQSSMGGFLRVKAPRITWNEFLDNNTQPIYASSLEGNDSPATGLEPGVIVIGNESKGIQQNILDASDIKLKIPLIGQAESLNAAVACGIILSKVLQ